MGKLTHGQYDSKRKIEGFKFSHQLFASIFICTLAFSCFLPLMLGMKLHDDEPDIPYNGAADEALIAITNAVYVTCTGMMLKEALLDSSTLYIPIKIAFPRFMMVLGVLFVSLLPYCLNVESGMEKLGFLACTIFAKGYFIVGGLILRLVRDSAPNLGRGSKIPPKLYIYLAAMTLFTVQFQLNMWQAFLEVGQDPRYILAKNIVSVVSLFFGLYFLYRTCQLALCTDHTGFVGIHYYELMAHLVVILFFFGTLVVVLISPATTWKEYTVRELLAYNYLDLFIIMIFFSTTGYIARKNFVSAKSQLATKKYFVRYISHEIRTPLNTVYMGIQLLGTELAKLYRGDDNASSSLSNSSGADRRGSGSGSSHGLQTRRTAEDTLSQSSRQTCQDILGDVNDSLRISLDILNDLLFVDKIEEGNMNLDMRTLSARELFQNCIRNFEVQAAFSKINLSVDLDALRRVTVMADEMKIAQVMRNTLSNALKFTPSGGHIHVKASFTRQPPQSPQRPQSLRSLPRVDSLPFLSVATVDPTPPEDGGTVRIEILDTGPGISAANKDMLFKNVIQFHQNQLQSGGGSGLGLFISNAIMKEHQGGAIGVLPGGVKTLQAGGPGRVTLTPCSTATGGCVFYIDLHGRKLGDDEPDVRPITPVNTDRFGCATIRSSSSMKFGPEMSIEERALNMMEEGFSIRDFTMRERTISGDSPTNSQSACATGRFGSQGSFSGRFPSAGPVTTGEEKEKELAPAPEGAEDNGEAIMFDRVLMVEDSKFNRKMMKKILSSYAREIVMAEDGVEGVAAVRECIAQKTAPFDVIFMDSLMPNMNGIDATKIILRELKFPNPIIAITGNMLPDDVKEFEDAGVLTVLGKPLQLDRLDEVLNGIHIQSKQNAILKCLSSSTDNHDIARRS